VQEGKGLDMWQTGPVEGFDTRVVGTTSYEVAKGSELFLVTAGIARKPGMSREDLMTTNAEIVRAATENSLKHSPDALLVVLTNPLDTMAYLAMQVGKLPRERIVGQAGILDSARMRAFIAMELHVSVENIQAFVLGGHGDTMVPLPRYSTVAGIPITELLPADRIAAICARTANGGAEITKLVGTSAWYAPGLAAAEMVEAILKDKKKIVPCSVYLKGEYGVRDQFLGVPIKLGAKGMEQVVEIKLTEEEAAALAKSAAAVKELTTVINV